MSKRPEKPSTDPKVPLRKRSAVIKDFEKVAGPLRGQNQDRKPKA